MKNKSYFAAVKFENIFYEIRYTGCCWNQCKNTYTVVILSHSSLLSLPTTNSPLVWAI